LLQINNFCARPSRSRRECRKSGVPPLLKADDQATQHNRAAVSAVNGPSSLPRRGRSSVPRLRPSYLCNARTESEGQMLAPLWPRVTSILEGSWTARTEEGLSEVHGRSGALRARRSEVHGRSGARVATREIFLRVRAWSPVASRLLHCGSRCCAAPKIVVEYGGTHGGTPCCHPCKKPFARQIVQTSYLLA
jgi:hypothetical protein